MKKIFVFWCLTFFTGVTLSQTSIDEPDSINIRFQQQLEVFPKEKIYVQTDKSNYLSGERIWLRAHLVDASNHKPIFISRYVYVEIINPMDDLVKRIKIKPDSTGAYFGYIRLEDDLAEGNYTMRAYTNYMRNSDEDAFFRKKIQILDPFSLQMDPKLSFNTDKKNVKLSIQFIDRQTNDTVFPQVVSGKLKGKGLKTLWPKNNRYTWDFSLSEKDKNRSMLLSIIYNGRIYNRYYTVPSDQSDYYVSFYPEGGYLVPGKINQIAYKALNAEGLGENVSGKLYDSGGKEITSFKSLHLGMGFFNFIPLQDESYYVICDNGQSVPKRFDLPKSEIQASVISARVIGNRIMITKLQSNDTDQAAFSLLMHHKGTVLYHDKWNPQVELYVFPPSDFPEGVIGVLLINESNEIVSERLFFNVNDNVRLSVESILSKTTYKRRERILVALKESLPVTGNIAVSVTDKASVIPDTNVNVIAELLLTSELKGYIESPASYFKNGKIDKFALDALMMTQGWRRYNIADVLIGKIETPHKFEPELAQTITGKADGIFGSLKEGQISLMATLDSLLSTEVTQADDNGRFSFNVEYPEGTQILVQSRSKRGRSFNVINIDKETFPELQQSGVPLKSEDVNVFNSNQDSYLQIANEDYTQLHGIRHIMLEDVTVTAQNLQKYKESVFYSPIHASGVQTSEDIERMGVNSLRSLLYRMPGIVMRGDRVTTTRSEMPVLFVIDNMYFDDFSNRLDDIDISSIESIFVLRDNVSMPGNYPTTNGAIIITTKIGGYEGKPRQPPSIDNIIPLGYQLPLEYYSPVYETPEQVNSPTPDLRTTIFWKPNLQFSEEGEAEIEFYSADSPTTYQVIGEGISDDGQLIRFEKEIIIEGSNN